MIVAILLGVIVALVIALVWAICDKYDWKHVAKYDDWYEEKFKEIFQRMDSYLDKSIDHAELSRKSLEEYMDGIRDSLREELSKIHLDPSNLIALSDGSVVVRENTANENTREPQHITEDMKIHENWYKEAKEMTLEKLPEFLRMLTEDYAHDYGTICHAISSGALATARAINNSESGGITGFQAGCIMWEMIRNWGVFSKDHPLSIIDWGNVLYPQYEDKFNSITDEIWEWVKKQAVKKINEIEDGYEPHPEVLRHWKLIAEGNVPFGLKITKD